MPDGKTHNRITVAAAPFVGSAAFAISGSLTVGLCAVAGCITGIPITPDLDQPRGRGLWRVIWWPYAKAMKHRERFSHDPVLGWAGRILYLLVLFSPLILFALWLADQAGLPINLTPGPHTFSYLLGLFIANLLHSLADVIVSELKQAKKKTKPRKKHSGQSKAKRTKSRKALDIL